MRSCGLVAYEWRWRDGQTVAFVLQLVLRKGIGKRLAPWRIFLTHPPNDLETLHKAWVNIAQSHNCSQEWNQGDRSALDELTPHVYRELHMLARKYLSRGRPNQTLQATALINEAYLRLIDQSQPVHFENRSHFFGIAARLMRIVLVDYARAHYAAKRGRGTATMVAIEETAALAPKQAPDVLKLMTR